MKNKTNTNSNKKMTLEEITSLIEHIEKSQLEQKKDKQLIYLKSKRDELFRKITIIEQEMSIIFDCETLEEIQRQINITEKKYE